MKCDIIEFIKLVKLFVNMTAFNLKTMYKIVFFMTAMVFLLSVFSQIFFDKMPCQLCLITRYMFLSISLFSLSSVKFEKLVYFLVLSSILTLSFSFYHLGIENHWWIAPQSCISELPTLESFTNAKQLLNSAKVYCDKVNWKILGISSTLWSFLFSALVFWIVSFLYILNRCITKAKANKKYFV